jgi:hypothetical protein
MASDVGPQLPAQESLPAMTKKLVQPDRPSAKAAKADLQPVQPTSQEASFAPSQKGTQLLVDKNNYRYRIHERRKVENKDLYR